MELGTETGSVMNHLYSRMVKGEPEPTVGMGVTLLSWTDRHPATVTTWDGKILTVQEDHAKRIDANGMSESQDYEYTPNPKGGLSCFRKDKIGVWQKIAKNPDTGRWVKAGGKGLTLGRRDKYHDYSF